MDIDSDLLTSIQKRFRSQLSESIIGVTDSGKKANIVKREEQLGKDKKT